MTFTPELQAALQALLDELDRLMLVGEQGRRRRGVTTLSVETLRYLRMGVARVLGGEAAPSELRGTSETLVAGLAPDAALLVAMRRVEGAL